MIKNEVNIHDRFSVEFKTGFFTDNNAKDINEFKIDTWIFVPNSLDINSTTYSKSEFYKDTKKNIRLITPVYSLSEVVTEGRGPFARLDKALTTLKENPSAKNTEKYAYQIKMLMCIVKSALLRESQEIVRSTNDAETVLLVERLIENLRTITTEYRARWTVLARSEVTEAQKKAYIYGDDFLGNIIEQYIFYIIRGIQRKSMYSSVKPLLTQLVNDELEHKKIENYYTLDKDDEGKNSIVIAHRNLLKKFIESDLFLRVLRKKDGAVAEQVYYGFAAGLAMIVATVIGNFAARRYGAYTLDLFIVLVVAYMLKDRIKDLARLYFLKGMSKRYFDTKLKLSIRSQEIGWIKEAFDFVGDKKVSDEVQHLRDMSPLLTTANEAYNEQVILYRKWVALSKEEIEKYKEYRLSGINDITRFNIWVFTKQMDNPYTSLYTLDSDKELHHFGGLRIYTLYFVMHCKSDSDEYYKAYRVTFNREGITDVYEVN